VAVAIILNHDADKMPPEIERAKALMAKLKDRSKQK